MTKQERPIIVQVERGENSFDSCLGFVGFLFCMGIFAVIGIAVITIFATLFNGK